MARIPLEDNYTDVIAKAQRGLDISDEELAKRAEVTLADLTSLKAGRLSIAVLRRVARHVRLGPDALEALANRTWYPQQPNFPTGFAAFNTRFGELTVNSYLLWDPRAKVGAAFDTGTDATAMIDTIEAEGINLHHIFLTHSHEDHVADLTRLAEATHAQVWTHENEPINFPGAQTFRENAHFHLGSLAVKTLLTAGHSPGMTTYYVTGLSWPVAIVGDAVFSCSMGGSESHFAEQSRNNREKIFTLPNDTVLACGHGPLSTVGQERRNNPFFAR